MPQPPILEKPCFDPADHSLSVCALSKDVGEQILSSLQSQEEILGRMLEDAVTTRSLIKDQNSKLCATLQDMCALLLPAPVMHQKRELDTNADTKKIVQPSEFDAGMAGTNNKSEQPSDKDIHSAGKRQPITWTPQTRGSIWKDHHDEKFQRTQNLHLGGYLTNHGTFASKRISGTSHLISPLHKLIKSKAFEIAMGFIVLLNMVSLSVEAQIQSSLAAYTLGLSSDGSKLRPELQVLFSISEKIFNGIYFLELLVRIYYSRCEFFNHVFNWLDSLFVVITVVETFLVEGGIRFNIMKVFHALRVFRFAKFIHYSTALQEMRILVRTLWASFQGLLWSIFLIFTIILAVAILITQLVEPFFYDEAVDLRTKVWLFNNFGTTANSFHSLFECTFTGSWHRFSRPMIEFHAPFAIFWFAFVIAVNFTVMKVVAALFLRQTLAVAAVDSERVALEKTRQKEFFAARLSSIFREADTSGDGVISRQEFVDMLSNPDAMEQFTNLELEADEIDALWFVCAADDGQADYEELLNAALKLKGSARTIDTVQVLQRQLEMKRQLSDFQDMFVTYFHVEESLAVPKWKKGHTIDSLKTALSSIGSSSCSRSVPNQPHVGIYATVT